MSNRIPRTQRRAEPREMRPDGSIWSWLKRSENQRALRFIGAAIAAAIGVLVTMGVIHKSPETNSQPTVPGLAQSSEQVAPQNAVASGSGNAVNVQGVGNKLEISK